MGDPVHDCPVCGKPRKFPANAPACIECQARAARRTPFRERPDAEAPRVVLDIPADDTRIAKKAASIRAATYELLQEFHFCRSLSTARLLWELLNQMGIKEPMPTCRRQCPACRMIGFFSDGHCAACGYTRIHVDDGRKRDGTGFSVPAVRKRLAQLGGNDLPFNW